MISPSFTLPPVPHLVFNVLPRASRSAEFPIKTCYEGHLLPSTLFPVEEHSEVLLLRRKGLDFFLFWIQVKIGIGGVYYVAFPGIGCHIITFTDVLMYIDRK
jgi:hypothetical protein